MCVCNFTCPWSWDREGAPILPACASTHLSSECTRVCKCGTSVCINMHLRVCGCARARRPLTLIRVCFIYLLNGSHNSVQHKSEEIRSETGFSLFKVTLQVVVLWTCSLEVNFKLGKNSYFIHRVRELNLLSVNSHLLQLYYIIYICTSASTLHTLQIIYGFNSFIKII